MSEQKSSPSWSEALRRYALLLQPYRHALLWAFVWTLFIQGAALVEPSVIALIINQLQSHIETARGRLPWLGLLSAATLSTIAVLKVKQFGRARDVEADIERDLPNTCLRKLLGLSLSYHQSENTGLVIGKVVRGNGKIVDLTWNLLFEFLPMVLMIIITFFVLCWFRVSYALIVLSGTIVYATIMVWSRRITRHLRKKRHDLYERADEKMGEAVTNALTVQSCAQEVRIMNDATKVRADVRALVDEEFTKLDISGAIRNVLSNLIRIGVIMMGAYQVLELRMRISDVVFLAMVIERYFNNLVHMGAAYDRFVDCLDSLQRVTDLLDEKEGVTDPEYPLDLKTPLTGAIEVCNVSFTHKTRDRIMATEDAAAEDRNASVSDSLERIADASPSRATLEDISLTIHRGEVIGIVGESGSGKSTLISLLSRADDPDAGSILFDGIDIRELRLHDLRRSIGYVSQDVQVMNASVADNIRFANPGASMDEVIRAAKIAGAHEFITQKLRKGYNTLVGDRGARLSGGQRQRIGIARAVLSRAPVLILDEATSSIDPVSINKIMQALEELRGTCTMIVVSHQLSTIQHADRIVVMENGKIAEIGTHAELLRGNGLYNRLVEMQQRIDAAA